ncbi:unnamed protein product [Macrosiphum euphorbiae]|uniref:Uncharacterized protein n=1 Tax=Macrosiphum euphorbiae TaxID=13131 RepID=A0AAV0VI62_9HEMI|nr:unnamed protein product [Macrosiphum euphorbiae]
MVLGHLVDFTERRLVAPGRWYWLGIDSHGKYVWVAQGPCEGLIDCCKRRRESLVTLDRRLVQTVCVAIPGWFAHGFVRGVLMLIVVSAGVNIAECS